MAIPNKMKKKKNRILFKTAGGTAKKKELGLGHVFRCLSLAIELKPNTIFFSIEDFGGASRIIKKHGFQKIMQLKPNIGIREDLDKTMKYLKKEKIDVLIIDRYKIKKQYINQIKKFVKTVVFLDLFKFNFPGELIVNGFIGFENKEITNKHGTRCLLGPKYQILNNEFSKNVLQIKKKNKILATFGGYDENLISGILLDVLNECDYQFKTKIILGPLTKYSKKMKAFLKSKNQFIKIINQSQNMKKDMSESEFGVCSGGITTYEFECLSVPFGIICQNRHQLVTAREWQRREIAVNLGLVDKSVKQRIKKYLNAIDSNRFSKMPDHIVDGKGANRVAKEILKIVK